MDEIKIEDNSKRSKEDNSKRSQKSETVIYSEDEQEENKIWKSCCLVIDKNMVVYISQFIFSLSILGFSCFQLTKYSDQCNIASPYYSLISFLMGKLLSNILTTK